MTAYKSKVELIKELRDKNRKLQDEVDSLWVMLDELKDSEIKNWNEIISQMKLNIRTREMMTSKKKANC